MARPHPPRIETANDVDCYIANMWRATQHDPEQVAYYADSPVNEADLHSRHRWLVLSDHAKDFRKRMRTDPDYYDPKVAGWYVWGAACWIGAGWCVAPEDGPVPHAGAVGGSGERHPQIGGNAGRGVHAGGGEGTAGQRKRPRVPRDANGHMPGVLNKTPEGHAGGGPGEKRPGIGGSGPGKGQHGVHGNVPDAHRPQLADAYAAGRGVHAGPQSGEVHLSEQVPMGYQAPMPHGKPSDACLPGVHGNVPEGYAGPQGGGQSQQRPNLNATPGGAVSNAGVHNAPAGGYCGGTCAARRAWLLDWFGRLRDRLRCVRVCSGDWLRVCGSESVTTRLGTTGIFFDPPYPSKRADGTHSRSDGIYASDGGAKSPYQIRDELLAYCLERGGNPLMRLCVAAYEGDGYEALLPHGWDCVEWAAGGGYGNRSAKGKANAKRERLFFSPNCYKERTLFDGV